MCLRYAYICTKCSKCFDIPMYSTFSRILDHFGAAMCCSRHSEIDVAVDRLCSDPSCLRRSEQGARNLRGTPVFQDRCRRDCLAETCHLQVFYLPCMPCFQGDLATWQCEMEKHWRPRSRRVKHNAVPLRPPPREARTSSQWVSKPLAAALAENMEKRGDDSGQPVNCKLSPL